MKKIIGSCVILFWLLMVETQLSQSQVVKNDRQESSDPDHVFATLRLYATELCESFCIDQPFEVPPSESFRSFESQELGIKFNVPANYRVGAYPTYDTWQGSYLFITDPIGYQKRLARNNCGVPVEEWGSHLACKVTEVLISVSQPDTNPEQSLDHLERMLNEDERGDRVIGRIYTRESNHPILLVQVIGASTAQLHAYTYHPLTREEITISLFNTNNPDALKVFEKVVRSLEFNVDIYGKTPSWFSTNG